MGAEHIKIQDGDGKKTKRETPPRGQ